MTVKDFLEALKNNLPVVIRESDNTHRLQSSTGTPTRRFLKAISNGTWMTLRS